MLPQITAAKSIAMAAGLVAVSFAAGQPLGAVIDEGTSISVVFAGSIMTAVIIGLTWLLTKLFKIESKLDSHEEWRETIQEQVSDIHKKFKDVDTEELHILLREKRRHIQPKPYDE